MKRLKDMLEKVDSAAKKPIEVEINHKKVTKMVPAKQDIATESVEEIAEESPLQSAKKKFGEIRYKKNYDAAHADMKKHGISAADAAKRYTGVDARTLQKRHEKSMNEGMFDREKRAFKRKEHEAEYKRDQEIERAKKQKASEPHHVYINGKVWKKDGKPVHFANKSHANKAGLTIQKKDPKKSVKLVHHAYTEKNGGVIKNG